MCTTQIIKYTIRTKRVFETNNVQLWEIRTSSTLFVQCDIYWPQTSAFILELSIVYSVNTKIKYMIFESLLQELLREIFGIQFCWLSRFTLNRVNELITFSVSIVIKKKKNDDEINRLLLSQEKIKIPWNIYYNHKM